MRLSDVLVIQRHLVNEITIRKKQNVGCHGTSYISRRALVRSNSIPNVGRVDYKGVTIFKEDGRSLFDLATSEHPAVMHGGVSTICDTGEVNDRGLPSQTKVIITGSYIIKSQAVCHIPQLQSYEVSA